MMIGISRRRLGRVGTAHLLLALSLDERAAPDGNSQPRRQTAKAGRPASADPHPMEIFQWEEPPPPEFNTTSDLSDILEAAKRRAGERDNQPATLPDLLDVLKIMHEKGQLIPHQKKRRRLRFARTYAAGESEAG